MMTYDDFRNKLDKISHNFKVTHKRDMTTIKELVQYLDKCLVKQSKKKTSLKSLKGIF